MTTFDDISRSILPARDHIVPDSIDLTFTKAPTFFTIFSAAINSRSVPFDPQAPLVPITARRDGIIPNPEHLHKFGRICGFETSGRFPLVYPLTFIYPMVQVMLARREMPLLLSRMLNTRMRVIQQRHMDLNERMDASCQLAGHRMLEKGVEVDVYCTIAISAQVVWECMITFYYRGRFGTADPVRQAFIPCRNCHFHGDTSVWITDEQSPAALDAIPDAPEIARWYLPSGSGLAFARLSGDFNPLHYWTGYAKILGFERASAQPLLVLAKTLSRLEAKHPTEQFILDIAFKGPVYYKSNVILKSLENSKSERFDIYCEGNPKPCICGKLQFGTRIS
jgi:hypothetical protein